MKSDDQHAELDGWPTVTVDEIKASAQGSIAIGPFGSRMKAETYVAAGVPVVRGSNIGDTRALVGEFVFIPASLAETMPSSLLQRGDLFFPHRGLIGEVGIVDERAPVPCMLSTSLMKLAPDPRQADSRFLFYFFRSPRGRHELLTNSSQVGTPGIATPLTSLRRIRMPLPPLAEQERIASVLGSLDDKIDSNRRTAKLLEQTAAELFRARFVDFVGAADYQESELGSIPVGSRVSDVYEIATVIYGRPFKSQLFTADDGVPLLRIRDLATPEPSVRTTEERDDGRLIRAGDIVVGMDGEFRAHVWAGPDAWLNQRVCAFDPREGVSRCFLLESIKQPLRFFEATKGGTTVIHLGKRDIDTFRLVLPPPDVMQEFRDLADPLLSLSVLLRLESRTLASLRDALLPRLTSGAIRISAEAAASVRAPFAHETAAAS